MVADKDSRILFDEAFYVFNPVVPKVRVVTQTKVTKVKKWVALK